MKWGGGKHKYRATRVGNFASKLEAAVYQMLRILEASGEIENIRTQVQVHLSDAKILYKPDFQVTNLKTGKEEWHEAKGIETDSWRIKRRLWMAYGPGDLVIWKGSYASPKIFETIEGKI